MCQKAVDEALNDTKLNYCLEDSNCFLYTFNRFRIIFGHCLKFINDFP
jgi:hypothetical protein